MDINQQKEQFSNAYLQAITSVAGYSLYKPAVDDDSIDWGIAAKGGEGRIKAPRLELQLKSTSRDVVYNENIRYPLKLKNYDDLRMINFAIPRILVLVLLPENPTDWLKQTDTELCLRHCAYWLSLRGMPKTENTTNVTLTISIKNLFTVTELQSIMQGISQGLEP